MAKVTVMGLGAMGSRMAAALLRAGHEVTVWNRTESRVAPLVEAGARSAETPRTAVRDCELAISMVRDDPASRQVWLGEEGALDGLPREAMAMECSTLGLEWTQKLAETFRTAGIAFIDAPVAGSRPQADAGQLIFLPGGDEAVVNRAAPFFEVMGKTWLHAGPNGMGTLLKLGINAAFGVQVALMGELMGLFEKRNIDGQKLMDLLIETPICSPAAKGAALAMKARAFDPAFPIDLVAKDFDCVLAAARHLGADLPVTGATQAIYHRAVEEGLAERNITGIACRYLEDQVTAG